MAVVSLLNPPPSPQPGVALPPPFSAFHTYFSLVENNKRLSGTWPFGTPDRVYIDFGNGGKAGDINVGRVTMAVLLRLIGYPPRPIPNVMGFTRFAIDLIQVTVKSAYPDMYIS